MGPQGTPSLSSSCVCTATQLWAPPGAQPQSPEGQAWSQRTQEPQLLLTPVWKGQPQAEEGPWVEAMPQLSTDRAHTHGDTC